MNDNEMRDMLVEYMGKGYLDNIIALFRQEPELMRFIPSLSGAEELVIRLGATALVEEMVKDHREEMRAAVPGLVGLLADENATIRGDAANLLGLIGGPEAAEALGRMQEDPNPAVRQIAAEALHELGR